jgi:hypothetical protein
MAADMWRFVPLMHLVPPVSFNLLNYALGRTGQPVIENADFHA